MGVIAPRMRIVPAGMSVSPTGIEVLRMRALSKEGERKQQQG
jgi:hypothetical protein